MGARLKWGRKWGQVKILVFHWVQWRLPPCPRAPQKNNTLANSLITRKKIYFRPRKKKIDKQRQEVQQP